MPNRERKQVRHRRRKALHVRKRVRGNPERPRLSVFRSLKNIYCQIIDDEQGHTMAAASSMEKDIRAATKDLKKSEVAARVGQEVAERAKAAGVVKVAFDRGPYKFHGRIKALAEAARAGGLEF